MCVQVRDLALPVMVDDFPIHVLRRRDVRAVHELILMGFVPTNSTREAVRHGAH